MGQAIEAHRPDAVVVQGDTTSAFAAALGKIDGRTALPRQIVAGNLKVAEALQKTIVSSGYAASFNG